MLFIGYIKFDSQLFLLLCILLLLFSISFLQIWYNFIFISIFIFKGLGFGITTRPMRMGLAAIPDPPTLANMPDSRYLSLAPK